MHGNVWHSPRSAHFLKLHRLRDDDARVAWAGTQREESITHLVYHLLQAVSKENEESIARCPSFARPSIKDCIGSVPEESMGDSVPVAADLPVDELPTARRDGEKAAVGWVSRRAAKRA